MTIAFQIRTTKSAKSEEEVPIYIRLVDGREWLFRNRTQILVRPDFWDPKNEGIKKRVVCSDEDRQKVDDEIEKLREDKEGLAGEDPSGLLCRQGTWAQAPQEE